MGRTKHRSRTQPEHNGQSSPPALHRELEFIYTVYTDLFRVQTATFLESLQFVDATTRHILTTVSQHLFALGNQSTTVRHTAVSVQSTDTGSGLQRRHQGHTNPPIMHKTVCPNRAPCLGIGLSCRKLPHLCGGWPAARAILRHYTLASMLLDKPLPQPQARLLSSIGAYW